MKKMKSIRQCDIIGNKWIFRNWVKKMLYKKLTQHIDSSHNKTIMLFTEGTVLGPKNMLVLYFHAKYIPIGNCREKIRSWEEQGQKSYISLREKQRSRSM